MDGSMLTHERRAEAEEKPSSPPSCGALVSLPERLILFSWSNAAQVSFGRLGLPEPSSPQGLGNLEKGSGAF